jgi:preprotein translocase subunit SecG
VRYTKKVVISALLVIVHVVVCLFLIVVVLLQSGKAADLAGAFGGMGSQTAFGPRGSATLLSKATTVSAIIFMLTSIALSVVATRSSGTSTGPVLQRHGAPAKTNTAPATPQPAQQKK